MADKFEPTKNDNTSVKKMKKTSLVGCIINKCVAIYEYCVNGVWLDSRKTMGVRTIKTINLAARSFLDRGLQNRSMSLTYSTVLALVPALALIFAISRGFGFQHLVQNELYVFFPAQKETLSTALTFVDSYLKESSQGIFVGIGIVMLLWTLISLLSNIENVVNHIWGISNDRSLSQKITDYIAICLMVPILMICSSGVSIFMSEFVQENIRMPFLTPILNNMLEMAPLLLAWLAFTVSNYLIPNTKVSFKYAALSGLFSAVSFHILQFLFVSGQIYVTKYNAIYGSFAFLPLMLIWLQFSWLIFLSGCVFTYSLQNVFSYNYFGDISDVSENYLKEVALVVTALVFKNFVRRNNPYTLNELSCNYDLPMRLVTHLVERLKKAGVMYTIPMENGRIAVVPAIEPASLSIGELMCRLDEQGISDFIPGFTQHYSLLIDRFRRLLADGYDLSSELIVSLPFPDTGKE